ncbi:MAG TPA: hypothetical protein VHX63_14430 [Acidobacteriaceae bacterium]|jgi:hypothetical protein|nr:hypothetical protein [Acidobacteriaceae bacterium]
MHAASAAKPDQLSWSSPVLLKVYIGESIHAQPFLKEKLHGNDLRNL